MKRKAEKKAIRPNTTTTTATYGLLVVYLSGDDDYGALHAEEYGVERLIDEYMTKNWTPTTCSTDSSVSSDVSSPEGTRDFNYDIEVHE